MKLICGNSNRPLAEAIAAHMRVPLAECNVRRFADEEVFGRDTRKREGG